MINTASDLEKKLQALKTELYGPWGHATNMKNYKPESSRYQRAKREFDKLKPEYDALVIKVNEVKAEEKKKRDKESAAKKTADAIKNAREDIKKADYRLKLAADLGDAKLYDEAKALREKAANVLIENKANIPAEPLITIPAGSKFKPQEPTEIEAKKIGEGSGKYDKYVLNPDGTVMGEGRQQYLVTIKNLKTGEDRQQPFDTPIKAREAFIKEYYSKPGDAEKLKEQLKAKGFIKDTDIADGTWYTGIDDFIAQYTTHAISQVKYGGAKNSDSISSYFNTVKTMGSGSGISSKTLKVITKRSDAKKDLDAYLVDLIGRPSTLEEQEEYFNKLNKAENESTQTTVNGTTTGQVLQDADRLLIAAGVAKKSLKGMDIEELLSSKKGSQVAASITEIQKLASRYGIPMDSVKALSYVRAGLGTKDALVKQEERLRQLSIQMHPYLKDHLMAGGTVKDVADVYASAKLSKLGVVVPDSTADTSIMAAVRQGKTIDQYNQELQADPLWRRSDEARNTATQFANTILSSFGFGG
jgi:hypothetical protein